MVFITHAGQLYLFKTYFLIFVNTSVLSALHAAVVLERSAYFFSLQESSSQSSQSCSPLRQFLLIW